MTKFLKVNIIGMRTPLFCFNTLASPKYSNRTHNYAEIIPQKNISGLTFKRSYWQSDATVY